MVSLAPASMEKSAVAGDSSERVVSNASSNELVFAVVGHVGSGTSEIAETLAQALASENLQGGSFESHVLKASDIIREYVGEDSSMKANNLQIEDVFALQDAGDNIRKETCDNSAIAKRLVAKIRSARAASKKEALVDEKPVEPDGKRRAYILDSLRHPDEVKLLRAIYQDAFVMVGVVADADVREKRLRTKYNNAGGESIRAFMERDSDGDIPHGQKVAETFYMADFFVENSADRYIEVGGVNRPNEAWTVAENLQRLVEMVSHQKIVRPTLAETAMYHANGAAMRSACLSRQVGAALVDVAGEVIATGCNEAPKAGGGVYTGDGNDFRCAFHQRYCSSVREQNRIIEDVISVFPELEKLGEAEVKSRLRKSPIGRLLEFSRAVHAEMDALLTAARKGINTAGTRLFVTTYPCHYCARHIVAAGVDEVQYIEPYPKSLAIQLHGDSISRGGDILLPSINNARIRDGQEDDTRAKVLFRPFTGVAPRLYRRVFLKNQRLKSKVDGTLEIGSPDWGGSLAIKKLSYVDLEAKLAHA